MGVVQAEIGYRQEPDIDSTLWIKHTRDARPCELADAGERRERLNFLSRSLENRELAVQTLERVLGGNELQPASYLERGAIAARAVARIAIRDTSNSVRGWGTGFLIAPHVLITNHHVIGERDVAARSEAHFNYEVDLADMPQEPVQFRLAPERLFYSSPALDFTVVAVEERALEGNYPLAEFGFLPLLTLTGKALEGEWLTIIQHPNGERKQLCVRENQLLKRFPDYLWYSTDTLPGASGSPVFNNDWFVVALHHEGVPEKKNGRVQTVDGRDFDPLTMSDDQIKWVANEGVRASRITQTLKADLPDHPLLQPLFAATPASARIQSWPSAKGSALRVSDKPLEERQAMSTPATISVPVEVTFRVGADGSITPHVLAAAGASVEVARAVVAEAAKPAKIPAFDAPFDADYKARKGFNPDFLGSSNKRVDLPVLSAALAGQAVRLIDPLNANDDNYVLDYHNFSVVMHKTRRLAIYSAANVSFAQRYEMSRPADTWRVDPRVPIEAQIQNWYYASNNFDRGHLTRREDLEYGATPKTALASAADTCHWTNCTPQHARFNQNREIWQGIERHVLESAIVEGHFNAQVITGPVLDEGDPEYRKIQFPLQYWKVITALDAEGKLFATAFIASQADIIDQYGIETTEAPVGPYKTYQVKIAEVERLTSLTFKGGGGFLRDHDPLKKRPARRRRAVGAPQEISVVGGASGYYELQSLDDIQI